MDIAAVSNYMSQERLKENAELAVMKKVMDVAKQQTADMLKMADVLPHLGKNIDILA